MTASSDRQQRLESHNHFLEDSKVVCLVDWILDGSYIPLWNTTQLLAFYSSQDSQGQSQVSQNLLLFYPSNL